MGLFSNNTNKLTMLKDIYNKAKYGTLKCRFGKTVSGHKVDIVDCTLQLEENGNDFLVKINTEENEVYWIKLTK